MMDIKTRAFKKIKPVLLVNNYFYLHMMAVIFYISLALNSPVVIAEELTKASDNSKAGLIETKNLFGVEWGMSVEKIKSLDPTSNANSRKTLNAEGLIFPVGLSVSLLTSAIVSVSWYFN